MPSYEEALSQVKGLVERFALNLDAYKNGTYNETQVRLEFINPFFEALGWDVRNESGYAERYKDVVHEDAVKVGVSMKAPDYSFRIGGQRKFFLEAKKPSVNIKGDPAPAYQLRRYAWSAKLPLSVLTDFEEFAVYDCRTRPTEKDAPSTGRITYFTFDQYPEKFREIYDVLSKEAVLKGSFDRYAETTKGKRGTGEVDSEFLKEIEGWREVLASDLAKRNPALDIHGLNFAVQQTIDRIVFLRIAEDRGVEPFGSLQSHMNGAGVYRRLLALYDRADLKYNSGLFDFKADRLSHGLDITDKVLKDIIGSLYYPRSPYEFSVIGAEILGNVYEQFLGKVIRLTAGHRAKVEEKPEVKKAGGVYYTPGFVVDYIVKNTVGRWLDGRKPKDAAALRVLDPACGSGSFLLRAYQFLLDWHRDWYVADGPDKHAKGKTPALFLAHGGEWRLTTSEKKRILTNSIFGVDIDRQAVEVTKLSLLLKVLEGENEETLKNLNLFGERALPSLEANVKCGNSLIGPDFYAGRSMDLFGDEDVRRVNAFDWGAEFAGVMKAGGFDCVIGNPPYVRPHNIEPVVKDYFWQHYSTFVGKSDIYCCFVERAVGLLKEKGLFGFIISNGWLRLDSFMELRRLLLNRTSVDKIIDFTDNVFERANVRTAILSFRKGLISGNKVKVATCASSTDLNSIVFNEIEQSVFTNTYKNIFDLSIDQMYEPIKEKMKKRGVRLDEKFGLSFGLKTGDDSIFLTYSPTTPEHKPLLRGEDVHRYASEFKGEYVWYVRDKMIAHRKTARPGTPERFERPKVLIRDTGKGLQGTFDGEDYYVKDVLVIASENADGEMELKQLTGIINSKLMRFYYETSFPTIHVQRDELASLPILPLDLTKEKDKSAHARMTNLVTRMLDLNKKLAGTNLPADKDMYKRQIAATDREIDALVYELYGLTEEEIKLVEGT
ncbi:MAG: N-6 DNA methylase [Nitrospirae bacterium]|nr:N-6 DNA methylase [Nitrospirota bacterium]